MANAGTSLSGQNPLVAALKNDLNDESNLAIIAHCTGTPDTTANLYQHGCLMIQTDSGTGANAVYQNTGSTASPVWTLLDTGTAFTLPTTSTDAATTTGTSFNLIQNAITTGKGLQQALNALTTGIGHFISHTTAIIADTGSLLRLSSTSVDTGGATNGTLLDLISTASLTATVAKITAIATTTGVISRIVAAAATLTGAGRYFGLNDGTSDVLSFGQNGHIHTLLGGATAPVVASSVAQGITAAAIVAGSTDVNGAFTTTGTQNNTTDSEITLTFNKTYTVAPKTIVLTAANATAASGQVYVKTVTATVVTIGFAKSATWGATPSYMYQVIA